MATIDAADSQHHGEHDHPSWLAHHFDTPEQQFDSGKLGIWIFLVTEVLFFSGMFCAYAIFRALRPDVFEGCSQFLNTQLGAINTGVLLFSSLTMAWAVRCAQTEEHKKLVVMLTLTLCCAMAFLGVKAIEYSHKWTIGLLPAGMYFYNPENPHPTGGPDYLWYICLPFVLITVGVVAWLVYAVVTKKTFQVRCAIPLTLVCLSFFAGVQLGALIEGDGHHDEAHAAAAHHDGDHHAEGSNALPADTDAAADMSNVAASGVDEPEAQAADQAESASAGSKPDGSGVVGMLAESSINTGLKSELQARRAQNAAAGDAVARKDTVFAKPIEQTEREVLAAKQAGVFFGIYYCMTGVHAIHILAGIGVLVWLLVRAVRQDFNRKYFGPVDYVGLYWHLVDLIWIYLFPLLYLIR